MELMEICRDCKYFVKLKNKSWLRRLFTPKSMGYCYELNKLVFEWYDCYLYKPVIR